MYKVSCVVYTPFDNGSRHTYMQGGGIDHKHILSKHEYPQSEKQKCRKKDIMNERTAGTKADKQTDKETEYRQRNIRSKGIKTYRKTCSN